MPSPTHAPPFPSIPRLRFGRVGARSGERYPFFEAATLGGRESVRGLRRQRYAGDAAIWGNAELRLRLTNGQVVPARIGILGLADAGRVFVQGQPSDRWHTAFGGGIWLSMGKPENVVSLVMARSEGRTQLYLQGGFMF